MLKRRILIRPSLKKLQLGVAEKERELYPVDSSYMNRLENRTCQRI